MTLGAILVILVGSASSLDSSACLRILDQITEKTEQISELDENYARETSPAIRLWTEVQRSRMQSDSPNDPRHLWDHPMDTDEPVLLAQRNLRRLAIEKTLLGLSYLPSGNLWSSYVRLRSAYENLQLASNLKQNPPMTYGEYAELMDVLPSAYEGYRYLTSPHISIDIALDIVARRSPPVSILNNFLFLGLTQLKSKTSGRSPIFEGLYARPFQMEWFIQAGSFSGMNGFYAFPISPVGIVHRPQRFDSTREGPVGFQKHDRFHNSSNELFWENRQDRFDIVDSRLSLDRDRRIASNELSPELRQAIEIVWFWLWHERTSFRFGSDVTTQKASLVSTIADETRASDLGVHFPRSLWEEAVDWVYEFLRERNLTDQRLSDF